MLFTVRQLTLDTRVNKLASAHKVAMSMAFSKYHDDHKSRSWWVACHEDNDCFRDHHDICNCTVTATSHLSELQHLHLLSLQLSHLLV